MEFDIVTTTTMRPDILKKTFDSFIDHLFCYEVENANLIINIDRQGCPVSEQASKLQEIIDYLSSLQFKSIHIHTPDTPSFSQAFSWIISQTTSDLVFNLEDDWELLVDIDFADMVSQFEAFKNLAHLRLSCFDSEEKTLKQWNKTIPWVYPFFRVPYHLKGTIGWCGHPSLNDGAFLRWFQRHIDPSRNPEKQIKGILPIIMEAEFGVWQLPSSKATIRDIGREWMKSNGYQKKGNKAFFTEWEMI